MNHLDPTQIDKLKEIGMHLKQHRQSLSISIEEVAKQTFIPLHILQALEAGESDRLPEPVYIQGFIRRYANVLKLDGAILANSFPTSISLVKSDTSNSEKSETISGVLPVQYYDSSNEEEPKTLSSKSLIKSRITNLGKIKSSFNNIAIYLIYIVLVIAACSALFHLLSKQQTSSPNLQTQTSPSPNPQPQESPSPNPQPQASPSPNPQPQASPSPSPQIQESPSLSPPTQASPSPSPQIQESPSLSPPTQASPSPSPQPQTTVAEPIESVELTVSFNDESWVRVIVDGKTEFEGILTKGDKETWTAKEQLTIRAGNAGAVMISLNQQEPKSLGATGAVEEVTFSNNSSR
ncbi:MAG: helix-turn-helix domain-containing protein [Symploca sp. SIO2C1]|nr:helix-turn-helix domain-containing protein [Symploca sp. SIO2C1]